MRKIKTKLLSGMLALMLMFSPLTARAEGNCVEYRESNVNMQDYNGNWTTPVRSYLTTAPDGRLMLVQAGLDLEGVAVVYYDGRYQFKGSLMIPQELPIFGAFYETEDNYYLLTGQENWGERADVEVYRVTKYDKSWNRISSVGLYDCNTVRPFDSGARMAHQGNILLIHTCHIMYATPIDGLTHQASATIQVDTDRMEITNSFSEIGDIGYVSHSFNQFVKFEDGKILFLDHGDAIPRAAVLMEYSLNAANGNDIFGSGTIEKELNVIPFPGPIGENKTGATLGGLEIAADYYLIAGSSVIQDEKNLERVTFNVFVAAVDKDMSKVNMHWLTEYPDGEIAAPTPHLVKLAEEKYLVLWAKDGKVNYTLLDGAGNQVGEIYQTEGNLSDCVPLIKNGKAIWYTWNAWGMTFYEINLNNLNSVSKWERKGGHDYEFKGMDGGYANLSCKNCGVSDRVAVFTELEVLFGNTAYSFSGYYKEKRKAGDQVFFMYRTEPSDAKDMIQIDTDNEDVLEVVCGVDERDSVRIKKAGHDLRSQGRHRGRHGAWQRDC